MSWDQFEEPPEVVGTDGKRLPGLFAQAFGAGAGAEVLTHLRRITIEQQLMPNAPEATLRDLEGQRRLVRYIEAMARNGRKGE